MQREAPVRRLQVQKRHDAMRRSEDTEASRVEDAALIGRILSGVEANDAYRKLVEKYWRLLNAWVRPRLRDDSEAEDVAQESFIRAFRALGNLEDHLRFLPWLLRIAAHRAADHARSHRSTVSLDRMLEEGDVAMPRHAPNGDPAEEVERREGYQKVLAAVERLPGKYRLVILLRHFEGMASNQIAAILGEPEGTIRNRIFRAHEKIRRLIEEKAPRSAGGERETGGNP